MSAAKGWQDVKYHIAISFRVRLSATTIAASEPSQLYTEDLPIIEEIPNLKLVSGCNRVTNHYTRRHTAGLVNGTAPQIGARKKSRHVMKGTLFNVVLK